MALILTSFRLEIKFKIQKKIRLIGKKIPAILTVVATAENKLNKIIFLLDCLSINLKNQNIEII